MELTQNLLNQLKWDVFHHPTYLPDVVPSDHLIPGLKCDLGSQHFAMEEDLQSAVTEFAKQDTEWYNTGIYKLILRYNKCLNEQVDYVKK